MRSRNAKAAPTATPALESDESSVVDLLPDRASEAAAHQSVSECGAAAAVGAEEAPPPALRHQPWRLEHHVDLARVRP
eukprot:112825-Pleurochrysis_carterae.AAC.2